MMKNTYLNESADMVIQGQTTNQAQVLGGTNMEERIGREIRLHRIYGNAHVQVYAPALFTAERLSFFIVYDRQPNGASASAADIIAGFGATIRNGDAPPNPNSTERFITLFERHWSSPAYRIDTVTSQVTATFGPTDQDAFGFSFDVDLMGLPAVYADAASLIPLSGNLVFVYVGSLGSTTTTTYYQLAVTGVLEWYDN